MREVFFTTRSRSGSPGDAVTRRSGLRFFLMLVMLLVFPVRFAPAQSGQSSEYHVKAAFLLNFAQFIEWPAEAFADAQSPIVVGVLGDDPFGTILEDVFHDASAQGRSLIVQRSRHV